MSPILRLLALSSFSVLAACAATPPPDTAPPAHSGYEAVEDEGFMIESVEARHLSGGRQKSEVAYNGPEKPGTIVVEFLPPIEPGLDRKTFSRRLQHDIETATARLLAEATRKQA